MKQVQHYQGWNLAGVRPNLSACEVAVQNLEQIDQKLEE